MAGHHYHHFKLIKTKFTIIFTLLVMVTLISCKSIKTKETIVCITSDFGTIKLKLYNETPFHRNNFLRLIKNGYFTNKIFERVIKDFMIQGGSLPDSAKNLYNVEKEYDYTIPSEINHKYFHKRGALASARNGDLVNPLKKSSSTSCPNPNLFISWILIKISNPNVKYICLKIKQSQQTRRLFTII